jgi:hypothetical protein
MELPAGRLPTIGDGTVKKTLGRFRPLMVKA